MNIVQVQLTEKQYEDLMRMLDHAHSDYESDLDHAGYEDEAEDAREMLAMHEEVVQELTSSKTYLWDAGFIGGLDLEIPAEVVSMVATSGDNGPAVKEAIRDHGYLRRQLNELDLEDSREYLTEAGIDEVDGMDTDTVLQYMLWMACHDLNDNKE